MSKLPVDHIYVILAAFLAALGCFTALALVGSDATAIGTLRDAVLALAGVLGGAYIGNRAADTRSDGKG